MEGQWDTQVMLSSGDEDEEKPHRLSSGEEALRRLALDSVLQKAEEIEASLREWRESLRSGATVMDAQTSTATTSSAVEERNKSLPELISVNTSVSDGEGDDSVFHSPKTEQDIVGTTVAWHRLTQYIVQLEGRLQRMEGGGVTDRARGGEGKGSPRERGGKGGAGGALRNSAGQEISQHNSPAKDHEEHWEEAERLVKNSGYCQVLFLVFRWLTTSQLCAVFRVSRQWRAISLHPLLWRRVFIRETVLSSQNLKSLTQWCRKTVCVEFHGLMPEMASQDEELHSYIARQKGSLESGLSTLLRAAKHVTTLSVTECNLMVTERLFWLCSVHCPNLLHFSYCSDEFPPTPEALWALSNGCPHLQSLHLPPCPGSPLAQNFNEVCLLSIGTGWPHLLSLAVGGPGVTVSGLTDVVRYCPWLQKLEVVNGPQLTSATISTMCKEGGLAALYSLTLAFTPISPKALHMLAKKHSHISSIHLHISLHTYFPGAPDEVAITKYHKIIQNFKVLQAQPPLHGVLHLHQHSLNTATAL